MVFTPIININPSSSVHIKIDDFNFMFFLHPLTSFDVHIVFIKITTLYAIRFGRVAMLGGAMTHNTSDPAHNRGRVQGTGVVVPSDRYRDVMCLYIPLILSNEWLSRSQTELLLFLMSTGRAVW